MEFSRGSQWRKWDLHIHTPASFHWNGGKQFRHMTPAERASSLDAIVQKLGQSEVSVFGIMDYWTFDGYWILREHLTAKGQGFTRTILPGIELRIEAPVSYRLNIQVVLSDSLGRQQLSDFKGALRIGAIDRPLSDESLIDFARTLDEGVAEKHGYSSQSLTSEDKLLELGSKTAKITRESLREALKAVPDRTCLIVMPYDTSDGLKDLDWETHPYDDSYFMQSAHIFETRNPDNVDLFLNRVTDKNRAFISNFITTMGGKAKPAISGSDAHRVDDYGDFPSDRITWLKADPTFPGLLQVVNEPGDRTFIGELPPKLALVQQNKTKYIDSIEIKKKPGTKLTEVWFNNSIPLSTDLVAIIGNKGKGKSALTDTLGLLGNTRQHREFTFLSTTNFCQAKDNKARSFEATLTWKSGTQVTKDLDEEVDERQPEMVKYIPQNFLETICTQIGGTEETDFDRELKKVIFSHVDPATRLGKASLDDLIEYKTTEASDELQILRQEMHKINEDIVSLEARLRPEYRVSIENLLKLKQNELTVHEKSKPTVVEAPANDPVKQEAISKVASDLVAAKSRVTEFEAQIAAAAADQATHAQSISVVDKLVARVENLERQILAFTRQSEAEFTAIGLSIGDVVKVSIDKRQMVERRALFDSYLRRAVGQQDPTQPESPAYQKAAVESQIVRLQVSLDEPNKRYDAYTTALRDWEKQKALIIGSASTPETLLYFENQLAELAGLPMLLAQFDQRRLEKAKELHGVIGHLAETYRDLYSPVNNFIETSPLAKDKFQLNFEVGVVDTGFEDVFFAHISQGVMGTFCGIEEGHNRLRDILDRQDFDTSRGIEAFLVEIMDALANDKRPGGGPIVVEDLMRTRKSKLELYDHLFGLSYLKPRYALRMGGKELNQLSPGERGTLLLVFYLLVDKDDIPLIIDQPEENLDNQTVYSLLVPCFKEAKQRRQILIVTHNPNLAVVSDAEQVIWANLDKKGNHKMHYTTGAIESLILNRATVDILEGTMPAFENRDSKYF